MIGQLLFSNKIPTLMHFRKNYLVQAIFLLTIAFALTSISMKDPGNPPTQKTGGPGEMTCSTTSGCHSGGSYQGTITLVGLPDTVVASKKYTITFTSNSTTAARGGYELTCLDGLNARCGTLAALTGSSLATTAGRQYVRQSAVKIFSGGKLTWNFDWTAPASLTGDSIKFYASALLANGNSKESGDNAINIAKKVTFVKTTATSEVSIADQVQIYPVPVKDVLNVDLTGNLSNARLQLLDLNGKTVLTTPLNSQNQIDVSTYAKGVYILQIEAKEGSMRKKIMVNR